MLMHLKRTCSDQRSSYGSKELGGSRPAAACTRCRKQPSYLTTLLKQSKDELTTAIPCVNKLTSLPAEAIEATDFCNRSNLDFWESLRLCVRKPHL
jgi:hypothetical protein